MSEAKYSRPRLPKSWEEYWESKSELSIDSKFRAFTKKALIDRFKKMGFPLPEELLKE